MSFLTEQITYNPIQGDPKAFNRTYVRYRSAAIAFCISLIKDKEAAEHIVESIFSTVWDNRASIKPDQHFVNHLFICLRNQAFDYLKNIEKRRFLGNQNLRKEEIYAG